MRFDMGLVPITNKHEAQAAYHAVAVDSLEAGSAFDIEFEALEILIGQPYRQLAGPGDNFNAEVPQHLDREAWVNFALDNNYNLRAATFARDAAEKLAAAKKAEYLLKLSGRLSYSDTELDGEQFDSAFSNARFNFIASSLALKTVARQLGPEDINQLNGWLDSSASVYKGA